MPRIETARNLTHMELRPSQVERIRRYELSRHRKAKRALTPTQHFDRVMALLFFGGAALILGIILIINSEWQLGNQAQIAREYRAMRHAAVTVEEWK